ncbi:MAG: hypothetical protein ABW203_00510 [Novosphingobium sp.]
MPSYLDPIVHPRERSRGLRRQLRSLIRSGGDRLGDAYDSAGRVARNERKTIAIATGATALAALVAFVAPKLWRRRSAVGL